jgi:hypothetical protein
MISVWHYCRIPHALSHSNHHLPIPPTVWQNPYVPTFLHCARPRASPPPTDDGPSKPAPPTKPPAQSIKPASGKGRAMGPWAAAVRAGVAFKLAVAYALYVRHTATERSVYIQPLGVFDSQTAY